MRGETKPDGVLAKAEAALHAHAAALPFAERMTARGHPVYKVKKKVFAYVTIARGSLWVTVYLPHSADAALTMPFAEPHHMFGDKGWVTCAFAPGAKPPVKLLAEWIDESHAAIAAPVRRRR